MDAFMEAIQGNLLAIIKDVHGNHVAQQCMNQFVFEVVNANVVEIATNKHGCCVMQRCLEKAGNGEQQTLASIITGKLDNLLQNAYGNYLVQIVLRLKDRKYSTAIIDHIMRAGFIRMSKHKFSSNVVEKCFEYEPHETSTRLYRTNDKRQLVRELIVD